MKRRRPPSGRIAVLLLFAFTEGTIAREVEEYNLSTNPTPAASPPNNFVDNVELADLSWSTVRNRGDLKESVGTSDTLISVRIDNGTEYLHLGGALDDFHPIVVNPEDPTPSSDLTLKSLLNHILHVFKHQLVEVLHIEFVTPDIIPAAIEVVRTSVPSQSRLPILMEATVLTADTNSQQPTISPDYFLPNITQMMSVIPVLGWSTYHGLDKIWKRLAEDRNLIPVQELRIKRMVEDLYLHPEKIRDQDVRFLDFLLKKLQRTKSSSFTVLALSQLSEAIKSNGLHKKIMSEDPHAVRRPYKPPRNEPIRELLPDYYFHSKGYTQKNVDDMIAISKGLDYVGFSLRAGMVLSRESVKQISRLVAAPGRFLLVKAKPTDKEGFKDMKLLLEEVGEDRVLFQLPKDVKSGEVANRIPEPKKPRESSGSNNKPHIATSLLILLTIKFSRTFS